MATSISLHWTIFRQRSRELWSRAGGGRRKVEWKSFEQGDNLILFIRGRVAHWDRGCFARCLGSWMDRIKYHPPQCGYIPLHGIQSSPAWPVLEGYPHSVRVCLWHAIGTQFMLIALSTRNLLLILFPCYRSIQWVMWWPLAFVIFLPCLMPAEYHYYQGTYQWRYLTT